MKTTISALLLMLLLVAPVFAQEADSVLTPTKFENVTWFGISMVKIAPEYRDSVSTAFVDYILPAYEEAGIKAEFFANTTGDWDFTLLCAYSTLIKPPVPFHM